MPGPSPPGYDRSAPPRHSTGSKIRSLYAGVNYAVYWRGFASSIGYPITGPIPTYEDNQATIQIVLANRVTPQVRHLDSLIMALHEWHTCKYFLPIYMNTNLMLADANTKPHEGEHLRTLSHRTFGVRFYPPPDSEHYKLARFDLFNATT